MDGRKSMDGATPVAAARGAGKAAAAAAGATPPPTVVQRDLRLGAGGASIAAAAAAGRIKPKGTWLDTFRNVAAGQHKTNIKPKPVLAAAEGGEGALNTQAEGGAGGGGGHAPEDVMTMLGGQCVGGRLRFPVLYRYNEGYTNAVKRPLMMRELL